MGYGNKNPQTIKIEATTDAGLKQKVDDLTTELAQKVSVIKRILDNSGVKWVAHRGATTIAPANSLSAYELAGKLGYWGCEADAQVTSDGVWVTIHDTTLDAATNGTGNVKDITFAQLQTLKLDSGNNIAMYPNMTVPTMEEYLIICKNYNMVPCIEMKAIGLTNQNYDDFISILKKHNMLDKVLISSFEVPNLQALRTRSGSIALEYLCNTLTETEISVAESIKDCGISPSHATLTKELVELAHNKGLHVTCWTIFNTTTAKTAIEKGADVLITESLRGVI